MMMIMIDADYRQMSYWSTAYNLHKLRLSVGPLLNPLHTTMCARWYLLWSVFVEFLLFPLHTAPPHTTLASVLTEL